LGSTRFSKIGMPLQVAAVCYRHRGSGIEFLLVRTNGGGKWTFPKGATETGLSHSQAAEREALEEAGAVGLIQSRHFHLYLHSKGVFWQPGGVQEYLIKAFLLEVRRTVDSHEDSRDPSWFSASEARRVLGKGREVKYADELRAVIDRAVERIERNPAFASQRSSRSEFSVSGGVGMRPAR